jgi:5-oxoprolinase (ATP-hydrolysing) subunit A
MATGVSESTCIDLNSDVGESYGRWKLGDDAAVLAVVTSANVACGFHAGDPLTIEETVRLAKENGVAVGAHPSYPDLAGFGRRTMKMPAAEIEAAVIYQIGALAAIAAAHGVRLAHVKPHGALYNDAAKDRRLADAIASAVKRCGALPLVGLAGSSLVEAANAAGLRAIREAFCDRAYEGDGTLRDRSLAGAVIADGEAAARQAVSIAVHGRVRPYDGDELEITADTLCIHGDTPGAASIAAAVRVALERAGVIVAPPIQAEKA